MFHGDDGVPHIIESADGVDQGAAVSPVLFGFGIRRAIRRIRARLEALLTELRSQGLVEQATGVVRLLSYLDDLSLLVPARMMRVAIDVAREELSVLGLLLSEPKTKVWAKSGQCPPGCGTWWNGPDGFVIVGTPFGQVSDPADAGPPDDGDGTDHDVREFPVGTPAFVRAFLTGQTRKVRDLVERIVELPQLAGAHQPAVQIANLLLRWCVPTKCINLLRTLPPEYNIT